MNLQNCSCIQDRRLSNLVLKCALRMGFRGVELEDVQQDVLLKLIDFKYGEDFTDQSAMTAALINFINLSLLTAKRNQQRYQRCIERMKDSIKAGCSRVEKMERANDLEHVYRNQDIQKILSELSSDDRALCQALTDGESIHTIANRLGCGWHTVNRRINRLREHFMEMGMDGYAV
jgi:RNA polymerase sigma factor (sigma-70 family)